MNILAAFVLGLLIGWLVEWIIDWFYWRGRMNALIEENRKSIQENADLKARITTLEEELKQSRPILNLSFLADKDGNDNFQLIKGIGPVFARRLRVAGIRTFEQLAQLTPAELEEILGLLFKRFSSKQNKILPRAKEFAQLKAYGG